MGRRFQGPAGIGVRLPFRDRAEAGMLLAERVRAMRPKNPLVLALPRGGVAVAAEVARALDAPLDILATRKVGCPGRPELGVGAVAEGGEPVYDPDLLGLIGLDPDDLANTVARERREIIRQVDLYRDGRPSPDPAGHDVVLVDDGLATGVTARAALRALRDMRPGPRRLILAVPVAAPDSLGALGGEADEIVALATPVDFHAVALWYERFDQVEDAEVLALLRGSRPT
ncbi:phosphoribosyltransferase [Rhizohabitans arisaemae]|uniref:phosphoribosyltransferase n=1 Tax=Rhizohabitans arisaemae TaxID=2720610 RepID=UPI0024B0F641|nr:phosphoribosyltransferase family protein [Rhizohabitans arisaemae]